MSNTVTPWPAYRRTSYPTVVQLSWACQCICDLRSGLQAPMTGSRVGKLNTGRVGLTASGRSSVKLCSRTELAGCRALCSALIKGRRCFSADEPLLRLFFLFGLAAAHDVRSFPPLAGPGPTSIVCPTQPRVPSQPNHQLPGTTPDSTAATSPSIRWRDTDGLRMSTATLHALEPSPFCE